MITMRLSEIAAVVGGVLHGDDVEVSGAAYVDSRAPVAGGLFVAVVGEHVDGHDYAAGAPAVLGSRPAAAPTVVVDDAVAAVGRLARHVVDSLDATVLAITGSQGKTGTKDYLAGVLRALAGEEAVVATAGNNNNELGVPLTVLRADERTRYLVVEMGARGIGHIAQLCAIAPPAISVVTNVGSAHLGEFGSKEAIAKAKGEIVEALRPDGVAVLNGEDDLVRAMRKRTKATVLTFGKPAKVTWQGLRMGALGRPAFDLVLGDERHPVALQHSGMHQLYNAMAAAAAAIGAGFAAGEVADALSRVTQTSRWRMEVTERADGLVVINDAYNANPESMAAALEALGDICRSLEEAGGGPRRKIAVLGPMYELGDEHAAGHRHVGRVAAAGEVDVLVVVGEEARGIADGSAERSDHRVGEVILTPHKAEAAAWLRHNAGGEDVVLVKASRGAGLEWIAEQVLADDGRTDEEKTQ